jgi:hypothetical protein
LWPEQQVWYRDHLLLHNDGRPRHTGRNIETLRALLLLAGISMFIIFVIIIVIWSSSCQSRARGRNQQAHAILICAVGWTNTKWESVVKIPTGTWRQSRISRSHLFRV